MVVLEAEYKVFLPLSIEVCVADTAFNVLESFEFVSMERIANGFSTIGMQRISEERDDSGGSVLYFQPLTRVFPVLSDFC